MNELTITTSPNKINFKKGWFIWDKETNDFYPLTTFGQTSPTKKDKWVISLETDEIKDLKSTCDYNIARIVKILGDKIVDLQNTIQELREE